MKELLASFLLTTKLNTGRENLIKADWTLKISSGNFKLAFLFALALVLSVTRSAAQSSAPVSAPITTDAYPHDQWKSYADYVAVINTEETNTDILLSNSNLTPSELALYTGYSKLLDYIKLDLEAKLPIANIAYTSFKKVAKDAATDPQLINMSMESFQAIYNTLLVQLHQ